ncbi:Hypothetical predicted protein [Olea europaea subsp. europaea]|uniref:Uncharacterized protein n=1 Tax=Olea europaea subsp. europaea TaxID=158383 RepID=A0A8S0TLZ7_OLEEU|nr:Hypothetical predicted protein [Olea europaea subsp. europaea]
MCFVVQVPACKNSDSSKFWLPPPPSYVRVSKVSESRRVACWCPRELRRHVRPTSGGQRGAGSSSIQTPETRRARGPRTARGTRSAGVTTREHKQTRPAPVRFGSVPFGSVGANLMRTGALSQFQLLGLRVAADYCSEAEPSNHRLGTADSSAALRDCVTRQSMIAKQRRGQRQSSGVGKKWATTARAREVIDDFRRRVRERTESGWELCEVDESERTRAANRPPTRSLARLCDRARPD